MSKETQFDIESPDWLDARSKNITATECASLFGINKYKSCNKLIEEKRNPTRMWSPAIRRGRILEITVLQAIREDLGWKVNFYSDEGKVSFIQHSEARLSATPDAIKKCGHSKALIELKTANMNRMSDWDFHPPIWYALQVHVQRMCTGLQEAYIACLGAFDPFPLIIYEIYQNPLLDELVIKTVNRFWDCWDNNKEFEVNKFDKDRMKEWLIAATKRIY